MDNLEPVRKLCDAIEHHQHQLHIDGIGPDLLLAVVEKEALSYLKTGGWHKWPEEKPPENAEYLTLRKSQYSDGMFVPSIEKWIDEIITAEHWNIQIHVAYWQPLPPLPSDKPEERHGKDVKDD